MDSDSVKNMARIEVEHGLGPSNTNNMNAELRAKYEAERTHQEKLKEGKKS